MTVRFVEGAFSGPGTSEPLKDPGKDFVNVTVRFGVGGHGVVDVEESYDEGSTWNVSKRFTTSCICAFRNTEVGGAWFRFSCGDIVGDGVYCRMGAS